MAHITIDDSRSPLLVIRYVGIVSDDEFKRYLDEMKAIRSRGPGVAVLDATGSGSTPATQRKMQADWLRRNREMLRRNSLGTAFVIPSAAIRGVLTAILWISPLPSPHIVVSTYDEGERWAIERLRENGLEAPGRSESMA